MSVKSLRVSLSTILPLEHLQEGAGRKLKLAKSIGLQLQYYQGGDKKKNAGSERISATNNACIFVYLNGSGRMELKRKKKEKTNAVRSLGTDPMERPPSALRHSSR